MDRSSHPNSGDTKSRNTGCIFFRPLHCPSGHTFDLHDLLQKSAEAENLLLENDTLEIADTILPEASPPSLSPSSQPHRPPGLNYGHWIRQLKADQKYQAEGHKPRPKTLKMLVPEAVKNAEHTNLDCFTLPATTGAYGARISKEDVHTKVHTLEEVKAMGIRVFEWNGIIPVPLLDKEGRVFAVLAGRPKGDSYTQACNAVYDLLEKEGKSASFTADQLSHRRGEYPAVNVGVTHGMGTLRPTVLDTRPHTDMVERLLGDQNVQRLASYGSSAFALWSPRTYEFYRSRLDALFQHTPSLRKIFPDSVFPAAAFNFPNACTRKHNDGKNYAAGWCSVIPVGDFNPKTGGHLILWELGLAVEFPPGSTILIPSATISHSNTAILDGEVRASFTQYASGGLFRWVDYDYQTEKALKKNNPTLYKEIMAKRPEAWKRAVELWSTLEELLQQVDEGYEKPQQ